MDDMILEETITRIFSQYGTVFVKIKRDNRNIPVAFAQYKVCLLCVTLMIDLLLLTPS